MVVNSDWAQVEAIELENDGGGLAFGIIGGRSTGVVVKTILPGGVADRDGRLQSGDHILRIGEVSMRGLGCEQAAAVLRQCGVRVRLLVARAADPTAEFRSLGASNAPIVPTKVLGDPDELDRALLESGYTEGLVPPSPAPLVDRYEDRYVYHRGGVDLELLPINVVDVVRAGIPPPLVLPPPRRAPPAPEQPAAPMLPLDAAIRGAPAAPELETFSVSLSKDVYGLGITVAGYVCEEEELSGIFVKSISTGSSADLCNKIQINDRIVEVDGQPLQSVSNHQAVELLRCTGSIVRLRLERFLRGPRYERLQKAFKGQGGGGGPPSPSVTSLPACAVTMYEESSVIDPEMESRATVDYPPPGSPVSQGSVDAVTDPGPARDAGSPQEDREIVIGREPRRDGAALRAIQDKWREILSLEPDGDIDDLDIVVGMMMKEPGGGLGISLEGTVEVRGGREVRPHHYIRSLLQDGPVGRSGQLRAGDELLEVNGRRLLGLHHLEVVRALKQLPASVCLVCARRPKRRTLIDTAQHKAAFAARNILGGSLQNLLPPPERMIKAKSESSITSACSTNATIASTILGNPSIKSRSRSLEPVSGLAMWSDQPEVIDLVKGDRGLGFSILDYQDPVEPRGTVIVVRSVVPGGAAARGGRLRPGDRLLSVNGVALSGASLATAVRALKAAPKGVVKIGVAKPLPTSSLGSGDRCKRNDSLSTSSQECVNSADSDEHTGFDSYHECLQEYQECLEVVQICLEPEDPSLREDDMSNLEDFSFEEMKNDPTVVNGLKNHQKNYKTSNGNIIKVDAFNREDSEFYNVRDLISDNLKYNGSQCDKLSELRKSDDSLDGNDEDMTITEDEHNITKLSTDTKRSDGKSSLQEEKNDINAKRRKSLSKDQNRDLSTSDEMVFAVTPTGLERISFERYWKDGDADESSKESEKVFNPDSLRSDESWKDCRSVAATPSENLPEGNAVKSMRSALFENSIQFIDHDIEGYDTCIEDDSLSMKVDDRTINNNIELSDSDKSDRTNKLLNDVETDNANKKTIEISPSLELVQNNKAIIAFDKNNQNVNTTTEKMNNGVCINANSLESLAAKKNIIKIIKNDLGGSRESNLHQINNNAIASETRADEIFETGAEVEKQSQITEKPKKKVHRIRVVEYYNDQAECLEEYMRQKKIDDEEKAKRETIEKNMRAVRKSRTSNFLKQINQRSEDSTDQETPYPVMGCHQCFLENYAYELTQAYFSEASNCKFCAVIREMLEPPKKLPERSHSAPAIMDKHYKRRESRIQLTSILDVPTAHKDRRKSAGPLKFFPCRIENVPAAMTVSREKNASPGGDTEAADRHWGRPRRVSVARVPNASLGISIVGGKVDITNSAGSVNSASDVVISGIFIKNVVANSPAGLSGQLRTGDRILEVDGEDVRTASHERAVQIIRAAGNPVTFLVQSLLPWNTDSSDIDSHKQVNSSTDTLSESPPAKSSSGPLRAPPSPTRSLKAPASPSIRAPSSQSTRAPSSSPVPELSPTPSLKRSRAPDPPKTPDFEVTAPDSPPLYEKPKTHLQSPSRARDSLEDPPAPAVGGGPSKPPALLPDNLPVVASPAKSIPGIVPSPSKSSVSSDVTPTAPEAVPPPLPEKKEKIVYSDDEDSEEDEEEDRRELEGRTYTPKGVEIDRASAGNVKRTKEEKEADPEEEDSFGYTTNKVRKKYANLGHAVVAVQLERGQGGLGLSLAGHRDRARMAVFVCGLRPGGAASRTGAVLVGDEILEVNGVVLHGRCHLNASAIIKGLAGPIFKVILLRRLQAIDDLAVKPITQFPVSLEEETDENRYSAYKNVRSVTIKKGTQSLGIMIIEGRHAEVGQGIFISDIQEGSAAEQAGLAIGDMILAVNKDSLLGSNYDTAASMLKKTEGVVVLTVCNPNKKGEEGVAAEGPSMLTAESSAKGAVTPARVPTPGGLRGPPSTHPSRPNTPAGKMSLASPAKEPMADPTSAAIVPGKETLIDISTESKPLGIHVVGGQDTLLPGGMVILEVYPDGKAAKDGRLKPGDQLLECNNVKITPEMKNEKALSLIKQTLPRMKMLILRPETVAFTEIEVDLLKKPGKGVGLTVMAKKPPPGVYISELVHGGAAEVDGRIQKGDIVVSVNGQSLKEATCEEAAAALKCAQAKVTLKVARHKLAR